MLYRVGVFIVIATYIRHFSFSVNVEEKAD